MDVNYLHHREGVERLRAAAAGNSQAREAHLGLAAQYRARIEHHRADAVTSRFGAAG